MSDWSLEYTDYNPEQEGLREALCTLGNGYFGTRGTAPEASADDTHYPGTYVAGCFNRLTTDVRDRAVENEDMVNVPNWLPLSFRAQGEDWFDLAAADILDYRQELDLKRGVLTRVIRFRDANDRNTRVIQRRFVHVEDQHLAGLETTFVAENWSGPLEIRSALDGTVRNSGIKRYRELNDQHLVPIETASLGDVLFVRVETSQSHIQIAEAARTRIFKNGEQVPLRRIAEERPGYVAHELTIDLVQDETVTVEKIASIFTSKDKAATESGLEAQHRVERAPSFDELLERHILAWDQMWRVCGIEIEDDDISVVALNLHIFHLLQTVSANTIDLDVGVPARGLHGEAYRGHIFWDELFIFPFLNFRLPGITYGLLRYRYRRLSEARWAAKRAGYHGAMFPWQSGSNGREESQTFHLNPRSGRWVPDGSHVQRHINSAIAYNVWAYYQVTSDTEFLAYHGAEMIIEIARFWASVAQYNRALDRYEICGVMGPDEYHEGYPDAEEPGLHNNAYTNVMAVWVLRRALDVLDILSSERRQELWETLSLRREELERWDDITRKMRVVFHDDGVISQFEGYDDLQEFDWAGYRAKYGDIQRLDRILESEGDSADHYKLSKQADVLMLFYLFSADELGELFNRLGYPWDHETIPRNIDYYLQRTSHGSTLSRVVHSWVLSRSQRERSWNFFKQALESDIADSQGGTTPEGIHLGAMAGTIDLIQRCYTGIETRGDTLWFSPYLPEDLKKLQFGIIYRRQKINLLVTHEEMRLTLSPSDAMPVKIGFRGTVFELQPGESRTFELVASVD